MSLAMECGLAAVRAAAVATAALAAGLVLRRGLSCGGGARRALAWALLLLPYLTPSALTGYAYAGFFIALPPAGRGLLYGLLLALKLAPLAALVLHFSPSTVSSEGMHCRRLLRVGRLGLLLFELRGAGRAAALAFALAFLLTFAEFDLASLLYVESWTVKLFDAHAAGLALSESLRLAALPALIEMALVGALLAALARTRRLEAPAESPQRASPAAPALAALGALAVTVAPLAIVLHGTAQGLARLAREFTLGRQIAASLFFAGVTAFAVYALAGWLLRRRRAFALGYALSVPGLVGPLVLSLLLLFLFQKFAWPLYDTPAPLLLALTLLFLPFGLALRVLLKLYRPGAALHAAELLGASPQPAVRARGEGLAALLRARGRFWVLFLLFGWGYFDLTASAILEPTGMTPVFKGLYNQMHYGRSHALSAMLCVALAAPPLVLLAAGGARAAWIRMRFHG